MEIKDQNLNLDYLQAELARIDILIQREILRWQKAGQDATDAFRGLYVADAEATALVKRPFASHWGATISLDSEESQVYSEAIKIAAERSKAILDSFHLNGSQPRLLHLAKTFHLNEFDLDCLLICLAPTLDLRYERLYGYLQDDVTRKRPTVNLILNLLCPVGPKRLTELARFTDQSTLIANHLIARISDGTREKTPLLNQILVVDEALVSWLLGDFQPHEDLIPHASLLTSQPNFTDDLLASDVRTQLEFLVEQDSILVFQGPDSARQHASANIIGLLRQQPILWVAIDKTIDQGHTPTHILNMVLRDAKITGAIPYITGWDACISDDKPNGALLDRICRYPGMTIIAGLKSWLAKDIARDRDMITLAFPIPGHNQRHAIWKHFCEPLNTSGLDDLTHLAGQFQLTAGDIRDSVATARDLAAERGDPITQADLFSAARAHSNPRLSTLARKIVPRYGWEDIVLPIDQLKLIREIVDTVMGRPTVLDDWGVGKKLASSRGVTVLFAGPPGTGKTMAAEILAAELELDLFKIDLSTVVSKYIGETEKNLERIFREATSSNAILFFDEADALFGKRSEVRDSHDRYANIEISYLLQRMEAYDGVTILATNLKANLDEAFTRRLQFSVEFPFPEEEYRLRIWDALFPLDVPHDEDLDFPYMAKRFKIAGGNIRNIIVNAAYLASADGGQVTMQHMLHGTRRELQKMGRLLNEEDISIESLGI
jgi:hypothetical protein